MQRIGSALIPKTMDKVLFVRILALIIHGTVRERRYFWFVVADRLNKRVLFSSDVIQLLVMIKCPESRVVSIEQRFKEMIWPLDWMAWEHFVESCAPICEAIEWIWNLHNWHQSHSYDYSIDSSLIPRRGSLLSLPQVIEFDRAWRRCTGETGATRQQFIQLLSQFLSRSVVGRLFKFCCDHHDAVGEDNKPVVRSIDIIVKLFVLGEDDVSLKLDAVVETMASSRKGLVSGSDLDDFLQTITEIVDASRIKSLFEQFSFEKDDTSMMNDSWDNYSGHNLREALISSLRHKLFGIADPVKSSKSSIELKTFKSGCSELFILTETWFTMLISSFFVAVRVKPNHSQLECIGLSILESTEPRPHKGEIAMIVSSQWWKQLLIYTHFKPTLERLGRGSIDAGEMDVRTTTTRRRAAMQLNPIDSTNICSEVQHIYNGVMLKTELELGGDYVIVSNRMWNVLIGWYRMRGASISRRFISSNRVELYPRHVTVTITHPRRASLEVYISQCDTIEQLIQHFLRCFRIACAARLWIVNQSHTMLVTNTKSIMDDDDAALFMETQFSDGRWAGISDPHIVAVNDDDDDDDAEEMMCGLDNLGNTCYASVVCQCLSHTRELAHYFNSQLHLRQINVGNALGTGGEVALQFGDLLYRLRNRGNTRRMSTTARGLKRAMDGFASQFMGYDQHDAQEFLSALLDALHEDVNQYEYSSNYGDTNRVNDENDVCARATNDMHMFKQRNQSIIVDLFLGMLKSSLSFDKCTHSSIQFDPSFLVSMHLPHNQKNDIVFVTIVSSLNQRIPIEFGVRIPMNSTVHQLRRELGAISGIDAQSLLITIVLNHEIEQFLCMNECLSDIDIRRHTLFAYEICILNWHTSCTTMQRNRRLSRRRQLILNVGRECELQLMNGEWVASEIVGLCPKSDRVLVHVLGSLPRDDEWIPSESLKLRMMNASSHRLNAYDLNIGSTIDNCIIFIQVVHRFVSPIDNYILQRWETVRVGIPMLICLQSGASARWIYEQVLNHCRRFIFIADDYYRKVRSIGYPFVLRRCQSQSSRCSVCPQNRSCLGCQLAICDDSPCIHHTELLVADWDFNKYVDPRTLCIDALVEVHQHESVEPLVNERSQNSISLTECLAQFTAKEVIECASCADCEMSNVKAVKSLEFWSLPPIIVIHLKRMTNDNLKNTQLVEFPLHGLDLSPFLADQAPKPELYDLFAVINHMGNEQNGHYTAFIRSETSRWYEYDDSNVKRISTPRLISRNAYMLFYTQRNMPSPIPWNRDTLSKLPIPESIAQRLAQLTEPPHQSCTLQ